MQMNIDDPSPERKNLIVSSMSFIIFYYGGGDIRGNNLQLPFINMHFENTVFLACLAWICLIWFTYRYTLTHGRDFNLKFPIEFNKSKNNPELIAYLYLRAHKFHNIMEKHSCSEISWENFNIAANFTYYQKNSNHSLKAVKIRLFDDYKGLYIGLKLTIKTCAQNPSFSQSLTPYILAFIAFTSPLFS